MQSIEWRPIVGYEGLYEISADGRVYSLRKQKIMKQTTSPKGYRCVGLMKDMKQKSFFVHRLMNIAFNGLPKNGMLTRHLDGNPANNTIDNLCWGTPKENTEDARRHGTWPPRPYERTLPSFCKRGHEYEVGGYVLLASGARSCTPCEKIRSRATYERKHGPITREREKLSDADVLELRALAASGMASATLAERYGISKRYTNTLIAQKKRPVATA